MAVHAAPEGGTYVIEWQPKFARDASTVAASLPDDGLDLTGLMGALERQPTDGIPRSYRVAEFTQVWAALHQDAIVVQLPDRTGPLAWEPAAALLRRGSAG
jgi:hypothetical protein